MIEVILNEEFFMIDDENNSCSVVATAAVEAYLDINEGDWVISKNSAASGRWLPLFSTSFWNGDEAIWIVTVWHGGVWLVDKLATTKMATWCCRPRGVIALAVHDRRHGDVRH